MISIKLKNQHIVLIFFVGPAGIGPATHVL